MLALIGLGSVDGALLDELVDAGRMPAFAALRERGTVVPLQTPAEHFSAAAFMSLWTGVEPEAHGHYYPFVWSPEEQRVVTARKQPAPLGFWETAAANGAQVLVIDPYEGPRPTASVATTVSGWQLRNRVVLERWDSPRGVSREWERRFGRGPAADEVFGRQSIQALLALRSALLEASGRAADLVGHVLGEGTLDLLVLDLTAIHIGGHQLWDPTTVLPQADVRADLANGLRDIYAAADIALGRMLTALPDDADVVVFSPLAMSSNTSRTEYLAPMLDAVLGHGEAGSDSAWRMRGLAPTRLRAAVANVLPDAVAVELAARFELRGVDWGTTRAFAVPSDVEGFVRFNLKGREREGIVDRGQATALADEIAAGLETFHDEHGRPLVSAVIRRDDVVPAGPMRERLPDLVVRWADHPASRSELVSSTTFGQVRRSGPGSGRSGNHRGEAWAVVAPGGGSRVASTERPARLTDLAATALAVLGVEAESAGRPLLVRR
jgi:predicted AlkP superfamily phosphohydrolase/phosphomutase